MDTSGEGLFVVHGAARWNFVWIRASAVRRSVDCGMVADPAAGGAVGAGHRLILGP